jgi:hypothetical protein
MIGLVQNLAFVGNKNTTPFFFDNFDVREIELMANGFVKCCLVKRNGKILRRVYPQTPYLLNYTDKLYVRAYHDTLEHLGFAGTNESNGINYKQFKSGWNVYCFNLTKCQILQLFKI